MMYNILDFGAVADGKTMNTDAINRAVQACAAGGGGRVVVPAGTFMTGTVWLKSHVELYLEHGAVLKASGDFADYCSDDAYPQNGRCDNEEWVGGHIIVAHECEDVAIAGTGTIDGNVWAFVTREDVRPWIPNHYCWFRGFLRAPRPGQGVVFIECRNVRVTDITMRGMPCWALFLHGCDHAQIRGVTVLNDPAMANTDGIDLDSCRFVTVSDCLIDTGDDAIAIRNSMKRLKHQDRVCEYITITNCVLASSSSVFRLGVGLGDLKHIRVSNLTVHRGSALVNFCTEWADVCRTPLYDVNFSNISATDIRYPVIIDTWAGVEVQNVTLENIRTEACAALRIRSSKKGVLKNITLKDFDILLTDDIDMTDELRRRRGEYVLDCLNAEGLVLDRVRIFASEKELAKWSGKNRIENCPDALIRDCVL